MVVLKELISTALLPCKGVVVLKELTILRFATLGGFCSLESTELRVSTLVGYGGLESTDF